MERQDKLNRLMDLIKSSDVDLGLDSSYTLEQFESDFDGADSIEDKNKVLEKALDNFDVTDSEVRETFLKFRNEIKDYQLEMKKEADASCNMGIESGSFELYKCIKSIDNFIEGMTYYVKIDDVKSKYTEALGETPDAIKEYVSNIKPLIWIISDDGIGTLKTKNVFLENFSDYFQK
jgi:methionine synthase II (cobalamin-independent)